MVINSWWREWGIGKGEGKRGRKRDVEEREIEIIKGILQKLEWIPFRSSYNYSSLFLLLSLSSSSFSLPQFLTLLASFLPLTPFRVSILSPFFFSFPHQVKRPKVPNMSHHSYRPSILIPLFLLIVFLPPSWSVSFRGSPDISLISHFSPLVWSVRTSAALVLPPCFSS